MYIHETSSTMVLMVRGGGRLALFRGSFLASLPLCVDDDECVCSIAHRVIQ